MKSKTDITVVMDRSGSMDTIRQDTIGGFNRFVADQQAQPGECSLSLVRFSTYRDVLMTDVPIAHVAPLTLDTFVPSGGTALLDALGQTIAETGRRLSETPTHLRPNKVLFVVFTDGEENSSRSFTRDRVFEMITHQRDHYQWEFLFLAANQDAISVGATYGFALTRSMTYGANTAGTNAVYNTLSSNVSQFREASMPDFTDEQRLTATGSA